MNRHWTFVTVINSAFDGYFNGLGLDVLSDDIKYLSGLFRGTNEIKAREYLDEYVLIWVKTMLNEPNEIKKQNAGRFAANTWIREEVGNEREMAA